MVIGTDMPMKNLIATTAALVLLLGGCTSGPTIIANANPNTDISGFTSYNFMQPLGTDRPNGVRTPLSSMLIKSISREMEARGFEQSNNPELVINVFIITEEKVDVRSTPTASYYHGYRGSRYGAWGGYETTVSQYTQGTLSIDLIDVANNVLTWEGAAQGRMRGDLRETTQERSDEVVGQIMAAFMAVESVE
jgi:hypothetical protein